MLRSRFPAPSRRSCWQVFLLLFAVALAYTGYTRHAWEDFYITFRASKNLATGHGLTFTPGERVHSFTSPLGTLLPALASLLTGNRSDAAALWIFRLMTISAYAGAGVVLWRLARGLFGHPFPAVLLVLLLATDAKGLDTATNGMESAFVVLFMAWNLSTLFRTPEKRALHLGLAWAGLMWTRPDSFIYIGASVLGVFLLGRFESRWADRRRLLRDCLVGGAITTALYGPWLLWAWWYYGSPIPNTIIAKSVWQPKPTLGNVLFWLRQFPGQLAHGGATLGTTFMPPYAINTLWPAWQVKISAYLSLGVILAWLVPLVRWEARVTAFVFTLAHFYLTYFANFPAPWYLPVVTMLGFFTLAGLVGHLVPGKSPTGAAGRWRGALAFATLLLPAGACLLALGTAWEMRCYQRICEDGNRRRLGEWLKAHAASPRDTVVVECLGYVGFFSNLKIYDYPGLGSPEVVDVLRRSQTREDYTHYFPEIISQLHPDWVVLRSSELEQVNLIDPDLLAACYSRVEVFDCRDQVNAIPFLPGRFHLLFDAHFEVYHRNGPVPPAVAPVAGPPGATQPITLESFITKRAWNGDAYNNNGHIQAHAPSLLTLPIPAGARGISGEFGFFAGAYANHGTHGAAFRINAVLPDGTRSRLFWRPLHPSEIVGDRGEQSFRVTLPPGTTIAEFAIEPPADQNNSYGWTFWHDLKFHLAEK